MKKIISCLLIIAASCVFATAQDLPQFKPSTIEGWVYNNPGVDLIPSNVSDGKIVLYIDRQGLVLTLTSPEFSCQGIDSIAASIMWYIKTTSLSHPEFSLSKTALTMVLDDVDDQPLDSVTCVPTAMISTQTLTLTLAVPKGLNQAKLRFVSWNANVVSCGAIKRGLFTAITGAPSHDEPIPGDLDGNGIVGMDDLTAMITYLVFGSTDGINIQAADVDSDGVIGMDDLAELINILVRG